MCFSSNFCVKKLSCFNHPRRIVKGNKTGKQKRLMIRKRKRHKRIFWMTHSPWQSFADDWFCCWVLFRFGGREKCFLNFFEEFHIFTLTKGAIKRKYMREFNFFKNFRFIGLQNEVQNVYIRRNHVRVQSKWVMVRCKCVRTRVKTVKQNTKSVSPCKW